MTEKEKILVDALRDTLELLCECNPPDYLFETYANTIMNYTNLVIEHENQKR